MFRGSLITFIFGKALHSDATIISDAGAVTLMSSDISRIDGTMYIINEVYASFIELGVSLWLLYRLIGVSMVGPAIYAVGMSLYLSLIDKYNILKEFKYVL
jgi:ATP-binding cassette subfamily C (CFTR/MRP) protein 1